MVGDIKKKKKNIKNYILLYIKQLSKLIKNQIL
jgi:hypothetical protein